VTFEGLQKSILLQTMLLQKSSCFQLLLLRHCHFTR